VTERFVGAVFGLSHLAIGTNSVGRNRVGRNRTETRRIGTRCRGTFSSGTRRSTLRANDSFHSVAGPRESFLGPLAATQ
jgi:hypothetical protein